jgi:hypothetical protein
MSANPKKKKLIKECCRAKDDDGRMEYPGSRHFCAHT